MLFKSLFNKNKIIFLFLFALLIAYFSCNFLPEAYSQENETSVKVQLTIKEKAWLAKNQTIRVRVTDYPPYIIPKIDAEPEGISIDYLKLIAKRTGIILKYNSSEKPFPKALEALQKHQGPDLISSIVSTPKRQKSVLFSKDYFKSPYVIFIKTNNNIIISGINDLLHKKIALQKGSSLHKIVINKHPDLNLILFDFDIQALKAVANDKADAYIGNITMASYLIFKEGLYNLKIAAPTSFDNQTFSMGSRNDWPELASIIDKGLITITAAEQAEIRNRYISLRYDKVNIAIVVKWIMVIIALSLSIIILFILWNRSLKKKVAARTNELKESEEKFRELVESSNDWIWEINIDNTYIYSSPQVEKILGYKPEEIVGKTPFALMTKKEAEKIKGAFNNLLEKKESIVTLENAALHKDGRSVILETSGVPVFANTGKITGYRGIDRDITERKESEKQLKVSEERFKAVFNQAALGVARIGQ